jgi:O-succinylbenzoic acid--CoA ligase
MADLVAIDLPGGPAFVDALVQSWEAGDAVAPLDRRLAPPARAALLDVLRPAWVVGPEGRRRGEDSLAVADGDALVMATSGSTGQPKGVVLTHDAVAASARATSARLGARPDRHRWLACLPLNHIGGLSVLTRALVTGAPFDVLDGFDAAKVKAAAGPEVMVSLVPSALARVRGAVFHTIVLGGSAPPPSLPDNVVTTYGMTETGSGVVYDGRPLDGVELAIGTGQGEGAVRGEILVRCPMLLRVYRDGADPRVAGPDGLGGWFPTGDGGRLNASGRLEVDGRMAEVVVTGGEMVWPTALEAVLGRSPGVREIAVWKRPDPEWGERVVVWVVPADRGDPPVLEALRALAASELAPWAAPRELVLVDELPRTASGKVRRSALV